MNHEGLFAYGPCPTVRDCGAVYLALFFFLALAGCLPLCPLIEFQVCCCYLSWLMRHSPVGRRWAEDNDPRLRRGTARETGIENDSSVT